MFSYLIEADQPIVRCYAAGRLDFLQVARTAEHLLEDTAANSTRDTLFILEDVDAVASLPQLRVLRPLLLRWSERQRSGRWAVVLPDAAVYAWIECLGRELELPTNNLVCFTSVTEASNWLLGRPAVPVVS